MKDLRYADAAGHLLHMLACCTVSPSAWCLATFPEVRPSGHDSAIWRQVAKLRLSRDKLLAEPKKPACCTVSHLAWGLMSCHTVIIMTDDDIVVTQQVAQLRLSRDKLLAELEK